MNNDTIKNQVELLSKLLAENRSDISQILDDIANGREWDPQSIEARHVNAKLPDGTLIGYDTLTTELEYLLPGADFWEKAQDHEYIRDAETPTCVRCGEVLSIAEIMHAEELCFPCIKN